MKFHSLIIVLFLAISCHGNTPSAIERMTTKADEAIAYCRSNNLNTDRCILIDMDVHSGKKRMFVYDFNSQSVIKSGMVSHGCCDKTWGGDQTRTDPVFSNVPQSHCSSIGKYKVGDRGWSNWGINVNYKLHGLEAGNSNAYSRIIVLHSWELVSDEEIYPYGTPEGWGCPAVSNDFMRYLDGLLKNSSQPLLLWIYK